MMLRRIVIAHRHRIVAEGLASALSRHIGTTPIVVASSETETQQIAGRMDSVALDNEFPSAAATLQRLRRSGARVVLLGAPLDEGLAVPLDGSITELARALLPGTHRDRTPAVLSPREREILSLVAQGLVAKQVAQRLEISIKTVEQHKHRIYCKLGVPNQAAAIRSALVEGLV